MSKTTHNTLSCHNNSPSLLLGVCFAACPYHKSTKAALHYVTKSEGEWEHAVGSVNLLYQPALCGEQHSPFGPG